MLIDFIGSPNSGKSTIAARLFAEAKELGMAAEFLPEQARVYICGLRYQQNRQPDISLQLKTEDHLSILQRQLHLENLYTSSNPYWSVLIGDGSPINSLFYLDPEVRRSKEVQTLIVEHLQKKDLMIFHTMGLRADYLPDDPNRVHDLKAIQKLEEETIPEVLSEIKALVPGFSFINLQGSRGQRANQAMVALMERINRDNPIQ
jgi:hypothetical protein